MKDGVKMSTDKIKEMLYACPPDLDKCRKELAASSLDENELMELAVNAVQDVEFEPGETGNTEDVYAIDRIKLLLEAGLCPNTVVDSENCMWLTQYVNKKDLGATILRMLLESGGNPNLEVDNDQLFEYITFKVLYEECDPLWYTVFQCFLVLLAYGGCWRDGSIPFRMVGDNKIEIFKNFERYVRGWDWHIYDVKTGEDVAFWEKESSAIEEKL